MASVDWDQSDDSFNAINIDFECSRPEPVWVSTNVNEWEPALMSRKGDVHHFTTIAPTSCQTLFYKFRIGENEWTNHPQAASVPDGFGGANNQFDVPSRPKSAPKAAVSASVVEDEAYHSDDSTKTETLPSAVAADDLEASSEFGSQVIDVSETQRLHASTLHEREHEIDPKTSHKEAKVEPIPEVTAPLQKSPNSIPINYSHSIHQPHPLTVLMNIVIYRFFGLAAASVALLALLWKSIST